MNRWLAALPIEASVGLYLLAYLPNVILTRLATAGVTPEMGRPLTGLEILPASLIINLVLTYAFIWLSGWYRDAHKVSLASARLPLPTRWTLLSGAGTALMVEAVVRNQGRVLPCSVELDGEFGVKGAFVGVPVRLTAKGAEAVYEFELSAQEKEAFGKSVAANTELMNIARGFLG